MKIRRVLLVVCLVLIVTLGVACTQSSQAEEVGIKVYNWSTSLGTVDNSLDKTKLGYSIDITNKNPKDIHISAVSLVIGEKVKGRVLGGETDIKFNKLLKKDEVTQLKGEIIIDTKGMDKTQIQGLEPFITGIKVTSEEVININYE